MLLSEHTQNKSQVTILVSLALLIWLVLVLFLSARGSFVRAPGAWPLPILIGVAAPLLVFLAAFWVSRAFHEFILTVDLPLVTGIHAWRFAGIGFLALYTYGVLPGRFAWPAGLGDMAIGLTAPWLVLVPAFLVPFFVMLHLTALFQARRLTALGGSGIQTSPVAAADRARAQQVSYSARVQRG